MDYQTLKEHRLIYSHGITKIEKLVKYCDKNATFINWNYNKIGSFLQHKIQIIALKKSFVIHMANYVNLTNSKI